MIFQDVRKAYQNLNPHSVMREARADIAVGLLAPDDETAEAMASLLETRDILGLHLTPLRRVALNSTRSGGAGDAEPGLGNRNDPGAFDVVLCAPGMALPSNGFLLDPRNPSLVLDQILDEKPEFEIRLARRFGLFRDPVVNRIIHRISKENALFSLVTALPNVVPNLIELPWAVGEFASDSAFLTINQVRMGFLIAAASGKPVGYLEQKGEIVSIIAGAFGWRALARELAGKIPLGGGLIPKAAISYAGTYVAGLALNRYLRDGVRMGRKEWKEAYRAALEKGKQVAARLRPQKQQATAS